ncbi:MFS transporter [Rhodococcus sp. 14C212]|uniref:MFS transporter n=1 Tax=Rhodococcus sp. 14C212 TaxID=2711209 RepID=UPI0013EC4EAD|nr:MFS transporter [Rhodococcus sp. 14C212]NGP06609.1 MFS transporter [Rhodococcus sp. 14C212]
MSTCTARPALLPVLVYASLTSAVVSSLGMLLVPTISRDMDVSVSTTQWMLTVNLLVGAVATPIMGRLSDGRHQKRLLLVSLAVILVGSVIAAAAPNFPIFLLGRALQGLSYGIVPVTIALARRYLPEESVRPAISSLSIAVAAGMGVGYPLTGVLASELGFRSAFGFAAVFLLTAAAAVHRVVPDGPDLHALRGTFDAAGAVLLGLGLSALLLVVSEGSNWGWTSGWTLGAVLVAAVLLVAWTVVELRTGDPLVDLRVFRNADVVLENGTAIGLGAALYVGLSVGGLAAQAPTSTEYGVGLPLFWAGFVMLPLSVGSLGAGRLVRMLTRRVQMTTMLPIGAAVMTASAVRLWQVHDNLAGILGGMLLFGIGLGTTYAAMPALIARNVAAVQLGSAVSFNQVLRTVGGAFGSAVSGAVLATHLASDHHPTEAGISLAFAVGAVCSAAVLTALCCNCIRDRRGRSRAAVCSDTREPLHADRDTD